MYDIYNLRGCIRSAKSESDLTATLSDITNRIGFDCFFLLSQTQYQSPKQRK